MATTTKTVRCEFAHCRRNATVELFTPGTLVSFSEVRPMCASDAELSSSLNGTLVQPLFTIRRQWSPGKRSDCIAPAGYWTI